MPAADQNAWIKRVLGVDAGPAESGGASPEFFQELADRLSLVQVDAQPLKDEALTGEIRTAAELIKAKDASAGRLVEGLEDRLMAAVQATRKREMERALEQAGAGVGGRANIITLAKARLKWNAARSGFERAAGALIAAGMALLQTEEFLDDPRSGEGDTLARVQALGARLPDLEECGGAIEDALDASGSDRASRGQAAVAAIDRYLTKLEGEPELLSLQEGPAGSFPSISLVVAALRELKAILAGEPAAAAGAPQPTEQRSAA